MIPIQTCSVKNHKKFQGFSIMFSHFKIMSGLDYLFRFGLFSLQCLLLTIYNKSQIIAVCLRCLEQCFLKSGNISSF